MGTSIDAQVSTSDAGGIVDLGAERSDLDTIIISGTFDAGDIILEGRRKRGWAPATGGTFTETGIYNNLISNITQYRLVVSSDFDGDVWFEVG